MKDLTRDSITLHILSMAAPVAISMLAALTYHLINLYFVTQIGPEATAGINAAGNATLIFSALTQALGTGTTVLVAHSLGRKDLADTNLLFNQSLSLSAVGGAVTAITVCLLMPSYMQTVSRETETIEAGVTYMAWVSPAYALLFPMTTISATLRGGGIFRPPILFFAMTIVLNAALAPVLIAGWGTGMPLGVKGAGLATTVAMVIGLVCMWAHFFFSQRNISLQRSLLRPQLKQWRRIFVIGWAPGAEFVLMFLTAGVIYFSIRDQGASAQAGFAIGSRIVQAIVLPGMALASAASPIAGQSFGAKDAERVLEVFWTTTALCSVAMLAITALVQLQAPQLVGLFDADAMTTESATLYLRVIAWTFVAQGFVYTCAYMFQGLGNTVPSLVSATTGFALFAGPAAWLSQRTGFRIDQLWYLLTVSVAVQAALSLWFLRLELRRKLQPLARPALGTMPFTSSHSD